MKKISFKVVPIVFCVLLFLNLIVLLSGGLYTMTRAGKGEVYKLNKLTGKVSCYDRGFPVKEEKVYKTEIRELK